LQVGIQNKTSEVQSKVANLVRVHVLKNKVIPSVLELLEVYSVGILDSKQWIWEYQCSQYLIMESCEIAISV
jgi:hypothetical protein